MTNNVHSTTSQAWTKLCGFPADEVVGKTLSIIQGPNTDREKVTQYPPGRVRGGGVPWVGFVLLQDPGSILVVQFIGGTVDG